MQEGQAFRPAGCYVGERQRVEVASLDVCGTMGHEIRFQKAGLCILLASKGANRDLMLEPCSGFGRREATRHRLPLGA